MQLRPRVPAEIEFQAPCNAVAKANMGGWGMGGNSWASKLYCFKQQTGGGQLETFLGCPAIRRCCRFAGRMMWAMGAVSSVQCRAVPCVAACQQGNAVQLSGGGTRVGVSWDWGRGVPARASWPAP